MKTKVIIAVLVVLLAVTLVACNSEKDVTAAEVDGVRDGKVTAAEIETVVEAGTESVDLTNMISTVSNAPWKLYRDPGYIEEIADKVIPGEGYVLNNGDNVYYVSVTSLDGEHTARYQLTVHKRFSVTATIFNSEGLVIKSELVDSYTKYDPDVDIATATGYNFDGWDANDDRWEVDGIIRQATEFTPKISPKSFSANISLQEGETLKDGTANNLVNYDETFTFPVPSDETKAAKQASGYAFGGWANAFNGAAFTDADGVMLAPWSRGSSLTLKSIWIPINYSIKYELNGGTLTTQNPTEYNVENGATLEFSAPVYKLEGTQTAYTVNAWTRYLTATYEVYAFEGWYFDETFSTPVTAENWSGRTGDVTLYAKYNTETSESYSESKAYFETADGVLYGAYPQTKVIDPEVLTALNEDAVKLPGPDYTEPAEGIPAWVPFEEGADNSMWYMDTDFNGELYRGVYFTDYRGAQEANGYALNAVHWFKWEPVLWKAIETADGSVAYVTDKVLYSESSDRAIASVETFETQAITFDHPAGDIEIGLPDSVLAAGIENIAATDYAKATGFGGTAYWTLSAEGTPVPNVTGATDASVGVYVTIKIAAEVEEPQEPQVPQEPQEPTEPVEPAA